MKKRRLGRTNLEISQVGFGGTWIAELDFEDATDVVKSAFNLGVTYFDTARWDGDSEEKIGKALKGVRHKCIIASKTGSRTSKQSMLDFNETLKNLQTDYVDIIQLHGIDNETTLKKAIGEQGVLQTCKEARKKGLTKYIGITGHKPNVLVEAIKTQEFDTVLVPLNIITRQAMEDLIPYAKDLDIGIIIMKPFSAKTSKLITCMFEPSLSLLSDEPELRKLLGSKTNIMAQNALRFILNQQEVTTVIPGFKSIQEVKVAAKVGNEDFPSSKEHKNKLKINNNLNYCRDCENCYPCPEKIDIAAILRFNMFANIYGLKTWAKKLYQGLEVKATSCTECQLCEKKCPYNLPITEMLKDIIIQFQS